MLPVVVALVIIMAAMVVVIHMIVIISMIIVEVRPGVMVVVVSMIVVVLVVMVIVAIMVRFRWFRFRLRAGHRAGCGTGIRAIQLAQAVTATLFTVERQGYDQTAVHVRATGCQRQRKDDPFHSSTSTIMVEIVIRQTVMNAATIMIEFRLILGASHMCSTASLHSSVSSGFEL